MKENESTIREVFANNFKKILKMRNIEQKKLALDLDLSTATVSDWVNGKKYPKPENMQLIADYLNCKVSDLRDDNSNNISAYDTITVTGIVPVYGIIPAGYPLYADQYIEEYIPVTVAHPENHICLKVKGDSMIGAGIPDGCKVLLHMQNTAENGQIVACRLNGDNATLKRFRQQSDTVILLPENPSYEPIIVPAIQFVNGEAQIIGIVKQIIIDV